MDGVASVPGSRYSSTKTGLLWNGKSLVERMLHRMMEMRASVREGASVTEGSYLVHNLVYPMSAAAVLEILNEPLYLLAQNAGLLWLRVVAEVLATLVRCYVTHRLLVQGIEQDGGLIYAYAQVVHACCLLLSYWGYFIKKVYFASGDKSWKGLSLMPMRKKEPKLDDPSPALWETIRYWIRLFLKLFDQNGEKIVLNQLATKDSQVVYGLVEGLGSFVVRFLLQPFEALCLPRLLQEMLGYKKHDREHIFLLSLKLVIVLGLVVITFGPHYSYVLIRLAYGRKRSDEEAPAALGAYCFYVMPLALNGTTEAFSHAVVTESQVDGSNWLVICSVTHVVLCAVLTKAAGSIGLIVANIINVCMRFCYSLLFIQKVFKNSTTFRMWSALPNRGVLLVLVVSAFQTHRSAKRLERDDGFGVSAAYHIAFGCLWLSVLGASIYKYERTSLQDLTNFRRFKRE